MSRRAARYTQADIARMLRAFEQVNGMRGTPQLQPDGSLRIVPVEHNQSQIKKAAVEPEEEIIL
jgi:hypothetical protein